SMVTDFGTIRFNAGHDLPFVLFLPTYTATAHHHGVLSERLQRMSLEAAVKESEAFAIGDYASALMLGDTLPAEQRVAITKRYAELTGLSESFIDQANLRVSQRRFGKELLRDRGLTVGRFDSRFTGRDRDDAGEGYDYDASYAAIRAIYTASLNDYLRGELGYDSDMSYEILTGVWPWDYGQGGNNRFLNTGERLRAVMHQQPHMKVYVGSGYFDLATPHFAADYSLSHLMLAEELRDNIEVNYYEAGHMMYLRQSELEAQVQNLRRFYETTPVGSR
ncbi:MAG: peptidase S10, partial [Planctomycetota bacterium]